MCANVARASGSDVLERSKQNALKEMSTACICLCWDIPELPRCNLDVSRMGHMSNDRQARSIKRRGLEQEYKTALEMKGEEQG